MIVRSSRRLALAESEAVVSQVVLWGRGKKENRAGQLAKKVALSQKVKRQIWARAKALQVTPDANGARRNKQH